MTTLHRDGTHRAAPAEARTGAPAVVQVVSSGEAMAVAPTGSVPPAGAR